MASACGLKMCSRRLSAGGDWAGSPVAMARNNNSNQLQISINGESLATRLRLGAIVGQEVAEGPVPFRLPHSDFRLLSNARTVAESLGLGMSGEGWEAGTGGAQILASGNLNNATGNMYDPVILKSYVSVFPSPQNYN